jgi:hypothetical protein
MPTLPSCRHQTAAALTDGRLPNVTENVSSCILHCMNIKIGSVERADRDTLYHGPKAIPLLVTLLSLTVGVKPFVPGAADHMIVSATTDDRVICLSADQRVVTVLAQEHVVADAAIEAVKEFR